MRVKGLLGIVVIAAGCASEPKPSAWSPWSDPAGGLSIRASIPSRAVQGDRIPAVLELRFDASTVPEGITHLDSRGISDRVTLVLRNQEDGRTVPVDIDDEEMVFEDPPSPAERTGPGWLRLTDGALGSWRFEFPLARAWEGLTPGAWEARLELETRSVGESGEVHPGRVGSPPVPVRIGTAPPRPLHFRPPTGLLLKRGEIPGFIEVCFDPSGSPAVDLAPRHGFLIEMVVGSPRGEGEVAWKFGVPWEPSDEAAVDRLLPKEGGPIDRTYAVEIREVAGNPGSDPWHYARPFHRRILWAATLRVTATAAEIEALRR